MRTLLLLLAAAAAVLAQPTTPGGQTVRPACTAARTTNCTPQVNGVGAWVPVGAGLGDVQGASSLSVNRVPYVAAPGTLSSSAGLAFNPDTKTLGVIGGVIVGQPSTGTGTVQFNGQTSGTLTLTVPAAAGNGTVTIPATTGTVVVDDGSGNVPIGGGANVLYRCATAGTLPAGALTITAADCGSTADTGLRVK